MRAAETQHLDLRSPRFVWLHDLHCKGVMKIDHSGKHRDGDVMPGDMVNRLVRAKGIRKTSQSQKNEVTSQHQHQHHPLTPMICSKDVHPSRKKKQANRQVYPSTSSAFPKLAFGGFGAVCGV
jgi:hypothetical protein